MNQKCMLPVMMFLLVILGCGGGGNSTVAPSSSKAMTAFYMAGMTGTIDETGKTISVYMPPGTDVTSLVATFATTGERVEVDSTLQVSGTTANDFSGSVVYTVTAEDGTTQDYTVTVTVSSTLSGFPDTTFGTNGIVTTAVGGANDYATAVAIQSDGKMIAAGYSYNGSNFDLALVRYNTDGTPDTSFGTGGIVTTAVGTSDDAARAVAIQSDGKIVVAGYYINSSGNYNFVLARYNADGSLNTGFGTEGIVTTAVGSYVNVAYAVAIQSDGRIVVAGYSYNGSDNDFAVVRYNTDGSLDTTFGTDGIVTTDVGGGYDIAYACGIQSDGRIVVAGVSFVSDNDFAVVRYQTDGSLDTTFGGDGIVTTAVGSAYDVAYALGIQSDGQLVVAGYSYNGANNDVAVARYNSTDGSLDTSFGTGGIVTTPVGGGFAVASALGIQSDRKIVVAGLSYDSANSDFILLRYNEDGSPDTGFYIGGLSTTSIGSGYDVAGALAIQSDGKIVVAGYTDNGSNYDFALIRYWP